VKRTAVRFLAAAGSLALAAPAATGAADHKPWATRTGCSYVAHSNNDGDSFHVRCGADEFVLRLYFVDAPETHLLYPERTREQAEHFGATLDDTLKAGARARTFVRDALRGLQREHAALDITGVGMDFSRSPQLPAGLLGVPGERVVFFYPGSSIGNFTPDEALAFLRGLRAQAVGGGLRFFIRSIAVPLIGFDAGYGLESRSWRFTLIVGA